MYGFHIISVQNTAFWFIPRPHWAAKTVMHAISGLWDFHSIACSYYAHANYCYIIYFCCNVSNNTWLEVQGHPSTMLCPFYEMGSHFCPQEGLENNANSFNRVWDRGAAAAAFLAFFTNKTLEVFWQALSHLWFFNIFGAFLEPIKALFSSYLKKPSASLHMAKC